MQLELEAQTEKSLENLNQKVVQAEEWFENSAKQMNGSAV